MRFNLLHATTILVGTFGASPLLAQNYTSPWSYSVSVGTDVPVSGDVIAAGSSNTLNLATLNANLGGTGVLQMRGREYGDMYNAGLKTTFEVRYALSDLAEIFGSIGYLKAEAKTNVDLGCLVVATSACGTTLSGQVADLKQTSLEIGYRQWLGIGLVSDALRPYFAVHGGVVKTDAIHSYITAGANPLAHWRLYDETYSYTVGGDIGATYTLSNYAEIGAEVGVRYTSKLDQLDADYGSIGLGGVNNSSAQVSVPVTLRLNTVF